MNLFLYEWSDLQNARQGAGILLKVMLLMLMLLPAHAFVLLIDQVASVL